MAVDPKQQKENVRLQNEYNEALKFSQSISSALQQDLDEQIDKRTILGKKVKEYFNDLKSSISNLKTSEDIRKQILANEKEIAKIEKTHFGANKKLGQEKIKGLQTSNTTLGIEADRLSLIEKVDEEAQSLAKSMGSSLDGLVDGLDNIPLVGGMLKKIGNIGTKEIKERLNNAAMQFTTDFSSGLRSGKSSMEALGMAGKNAGRSIVTALSSPIVILGLIAAALAAGIVLFNQIEAAARAFRDETGLLISQTGEMPKNIQNAFLATTQLGASVEDVSKAAAAFVNEFDKLEQPSEAVLTSIVTLNKNFGVGVEEATKLNKVFQNIGGLTATQSQLLVGQTAEMAKIAGVAPQQVIKDMADNAGAAYTFFGGMPEELAKAAVSAAKMGTSIAEASKVANSLLDYESSVTKELEASAILGTNLNLSRARYLAANNDILGAQQAVLDQVSNLGDLTKLNKFEQDALVEATGMELESLVNQQRIRERFGKLQGEQLAAAHALAKSGVDITKATDEDLIAQQKRLETQKELQSITENLSNKFNEVKNVLFSAFLPLANFVMPVIGDIINLLGAILIPTFKLLGSVIGAILKPIQATYNVIKALVTDGISGMVAQFKEMGPLMAGIVGIVITLAGIWVATLLPAVLTTATSMAEGILKSLTKAIPAAFKFAGGLFGAAQATITTATTMAGNILKSLFAAIPAAFTFASGLFSAAAGALAMAAPLLPIIGTLVVIGGLIAAIVAHLRGDIDLGVIFDKLKAGFESVVSFLSEIPQILFDGLSNIGSFIVEKLTSISPALGTAVSDFFSNIGQYFGGLGDIFKGIFTLDFGLLMDGMKKVGGALFNQISLIPKLLFNGLSNIGSFLVEKLMSVSPALGGIVSNVFSNIGQYFSGIGDIFKGIFTLDFGLLMDGMKKVGGALLNYFTAIPKLLFNGLSNIGQFIFEKIKEGFLNLPNTFVEAFLSIGEKIRTFFEGLLPSWARGMLSGGKSDSSEIQESQQLSFAGSIDDGIVQGGNIVSTDPEDTLIASKEPQSLLSGLVENSPFAAIAGGLSNIVGGQGGDNTLGNQQIIQKLDELKEAYMSNKDVYMDKEKVSSNVLKQNERSSENIFGLNFS